MNPGKTTNRREGFQPNPKLRLREPVRGAGYELIRSRPLAHPCQDFSLRSNSYFGFPNRNSRTVEDLLGHKDVATTRISPRVRQPPGLGVAGPLEAG